MGGGPAGHGASLIQDPCSAGRRSLAGCASGRCAISEPVTGRALGPAVSEAAVGPAASYRA
ncbi:MAG: hypothetical protein J2P32_06695, partial [Actinobacteria bacterium]|nr:hypothetical protein [Actinomycetota bacterium]